MNQEYKEAARLFWNYFKNGAEVKISTSEGDNISVASVSMAAGGEKLYFATPENSLQRIQINNNPYVSLCAKHVSVTGKARDLGPASKATNKQIRALLTSTFPGGVSPSDKDGALNMAEVTPLTAGFTDARTGEKFIIDFIHQTAEITEPEA